MFEQTRECRTMQERRAKQSRRLHEMRLQDGRESGQEEVAEESGLNSTSLSQAMMFEHSIRAKMRFGLMRQLVTDLYGALGGFIEENDRLRTPVGFHAQTPEPARVDHLVAYCQNLLALTRPVISDPAPTQSDAVVQAYAKALKPIAREMKAFLTENSQTYGVPEGRLALVVSRCRKYEQALSEFVADLNNIWHSLAKQKGQGAQPA